MKNAESCDAVDENDNKLVFWYEFCWLITNVNQQQCSTSVFYVRGLH